MASIIPAKMLNSEKIENSPIRNIIPTINFRKVTIDL